MSDGLGDDFLPPANSPGLVARRRAERMRRWAMIGGPIAAVVLLVLLLVLVGGGDDSSPQATPTTTHTTVTTRANPSSTTTTTDDLSSTTTSSTPGAEAGPGPGSTTGGGTQNPPATGSAPDPSAKVSVAEDAGACVWNADTQELMDSGTLANSGTEEAVVEVEVTWSDATGELDSWTDVESVPAGGNATWSVSSSWFDAPQGLTCQTALI